MSPSPFVPQGAPATFERTDQGVDFATTPGGPLVAPWPGTVSLASPNPGGFGTHYPLYTPSAGPYAGHTFYLGHTYAATTGRVNQGDVISNTGHGTEPWMGNAVGIPGHAEVGVLLPDGQYPNMSAGAALKDFVLGQSVVGQPNASSGGGGGGGGFDLLDPSTWVSAIAGAGAKMLLYAVFIFGGALLVIRGAHRTLDSGAAA